MNCLLRASRHPHVDAMACPGYRGAGGRALAMLLLVVFAAAALAPSASHAHELSLARFELSLAEDDPRDAETSSGRPRFRLTVMLPEGALRQGSDRLSWPEGCSVENMQETYRNGVRLSFTFACQEGLPADAELATPWGQDGAVLSSRLGQPTNTANTEPVALFIPGQRTGVTLPLGQNNGGSRSLLDTARDYTNLGMFHILEGWDHLAFVLCLCLLMGGRGLFWLITAFTLGHSISLALAYFGYLTVPMRPVEAVIALSVAFMAREAMLSPPPAATRTPLGLRYPAVVAAFGLLHGLGFASELEGLGISAGERITGLLSFNIGVEIGQLAFVGLVLLLLAAAGQLAWREQARLAALGGAGVLGAYWFTERIAALI